MQFSQSDRQSLLYVLYATTIRAVSLIYIATTVMKELLDIAELLIGASISQYFICYGLFTDHLSGPSLFDLPKTTVVAVSFEITNCVSSGLNAAR